MYKESLSSISNALSVGSFAIRASAARKPLPAAVVLGQVASPTYFVVRSEWEKAHLSPGSLAVRALLEPGRVESGR